MTSDLKARLVNPITRKRQNSRRAAFSLLFSDCFRLKSIEDLVGRLNVAWSGDKQAR